ncbi:methyltransferase domain-containing protein [Petrotoga mexicana]|nr:methyltransferase domain-containing protein [Petrotoga mexicana]
MWIFFTILSLLILYLLFFWVIPFSLKGAIFDPSRKRDVEKMVNMAEIKGDEISVDLGSGDGRVVIAFAEKGAQAHGFEINPFLVLISRINIRRAGLKGKAFIHWKNFWKADLSKFDIITVFQVDFAMNELENKLKKELKPGSKVISNQWTFPNWKYSKYENGIYVYDSSELPTK